MIDFRWDQMQRRELQWPTPTASKLSKQSWIIWRKSIDLFTKDLKFGMENWQKKMIVTIIWEFHLGFVSLITESHQLNTNWSSRKNKKKRKRRWSSVISIRMETQFLASIWRNWKDLKGVPKSKSNDTENFAFFPTAKTHAVSNAPLNSAASAVEKNVIMKLWTAPDIKCTSRINGSGRDFSRSRKIRRLMMMETMSWRPRVNAHEC